MSQPGSAIVISTSVIRRVALIVVAIAILMAIALVISQQRDRFGGPFGRGIGDQIDRNGYQAIFLVGGQTVFFGKAVAQGDDYLLITEVFYLSAGAGGASPSPDQPGQLIKRGRELHGPREPMIVPLRDVLFIENLRDDSEVVQAIRKFKAGELPLATQPPTLPPPTVQPTPSPRPSPTR